MQSLLNFFYRYKSIVLFLVIELVCIWMIISFNGYQGSSFFNSSNIFTGKVIQVTDNIKYYFKLQTINNDLANENTNLRYLLEIEKQKTLLAKERISDTLRLFQYSYINAKVVNNTTNKLSNYFTLDKGTEDGVYPGMGVISTNGGVAGRIKSCSGHYSTVLSILNDKWPLSAKISKGNIDGIVEWKGNDPTEADLTHVGKHHKISIGDTVVTSGYMNIFPYGIMIGKIKSVVDDGKKYNIKINLSTDYTSMSFVSVLKNKLSIEQDSIEKSVSTFKDK